MSRQGSLCDTLKPAAKRRSLRASAEFIARLQSTLPVPAASQASPWRSPLTSAWSGFAVVGQLSQAFPTPSESPSAWLEFATVRQLSVVSSTPSPSLSATASSLTYTSLFVSTSAGSRFVACESNATLEPSVESDPVLLTLPPFAFVPSARLDASARPPVVRSFTYTSPLTSVSTGSKLEARDQNATDLPRADNE